MDDSVEKQPFWRTPRSVRTAAMLLALWLAGPGNLALWQMLVRLGGQGEMGRHPLLLGVGALPIIFGLIGVLLLLFAWRWTFKAAALVLLVTAGAMQHFMLAYGIVIDPGMVANALHTNYTEARDLVGWGMAGQVLLVAGLPAAWLFSLQLRPERLWPRLWRNTALMALLLALTAGTIFALYRDLAPLVRNHLELRYMTNPVSPVLSTVSAVTRPWRKKRAGPLVSISAGATLGPSYAAPAGGGPASPPPLLILVVGETARADHFGLNGYVRDTTPELARRDVLSFTDVRSCWTNTMVSVPCMFSSLGRERWLKRDAEHENLLDVLQAAGLAVLWLDNQAGCKEVCDRVPSVSTSGDAARNAFAPVREAAPGLCSEGDCLDDILLAGLDERVAALPAERRAKGVVLVMHQMGSHGPAYYRRSSAASKRFLPECATHALAQCDHEALINVYDNSIIETDRFLGHAIDWLQAQRDRYAPGLLYVSDHGESLGEYGLFLHGLPYSIAPDEQKRVPMVLWMDERLAQRARMDRQCLAGRRAQALTHDNFYPGVLGLLDVQTPTYVPALDPFAPCRAAGPGGAAAGPAAAPLPRS